MKLLIASVGKSLESLVVKRFEHAAWYLLTDTVTGTVEPLRHKTPHDRHEVLQRAIAERVEAVVAGKLGDHSIKVLHNAGIQCAPLHGTAGEEALQRIVAGEVALRSPLEMAEERGMVTGKTNGVPVRSRVPKPTTGYTSDTARGQHHLQQYGGRGH